MTTESTETIDDVSTYLREGEAILSALRDVVKTERSYFEYLKGTRDYQEWLKRKQERDYRESLNRRFEKAKARAKLAYGRKP